MTIAPQRTAARGQRRFPPDFLWGAATAAYQIEGAVGEDGRGPSIWDTFSRTPGAVLNGDTGDVAADHYHRVDEDVALMGRLGLRAYRFSVSWPRIQPTGRGPALAAGLDFYRRLSDRLLEHDIAPVVTLYHWDLPQALQDAGGWPARDTAWRFADYAGLVAEALGDRVGLWTTLNEPWCSAYLGYSSGEHAPGGTDPRQALQAVHTLNLAHGLGARAVRAALGERAPVSVTLNLQVNRAASDTPEDVAAKARLDRVANEVFLGPMLDGVYPEQVVAETAHLTDWSFVHEGDLDLIRVPLDALGVNYYTTSLVRATPPGAPMTGNSLASPGREHPPADVATEIEWLPQEGDQTAMGWVVEPQGLTDLLVQLHQRYPGLPLHITENGAAYADEVGRDGRVHDEQRTAYLHAHLEAVGRAMDAGADVRGYFVWSFMDNFEWAWGYTRRFGIVHVDYDTLERTVKDSGLWYRRLIHTGALPPLDTPPAG